MIAILGMKAILLPSQFLRLAARQLCEGIAYTVNNQSTQLISTRPQS